VASAWPATPRRAISGAVAACNGAQKGADSSALPQTLHVAGVAVESVRRRAAAAAGS